MQNFQLWRMQREYEQFSTTKRVHGDLQYSKCMNKNYKFCI
ncbi:unnamed protein product [Larinioides sclopetarius]|uniref:Uncharacterized protein n=1 Tax=Larinioides sclopetarius TaxID=280406 RepID=A0AAV2B561_9ARAC